MGRWLPPALLAASMLTSAKGAEVRPGHASLIGERATAAQRAKAAEWIVARFETLGIEASAVPYRVPNVHWSLDLVMPPMRGTNVVAEIPATRSSDEFLVLGAHYDSEPGSPGADDNASGTLAVIDVAHRIAALPRRERNLVVVLFDQEEEGEIGSQAFAHQWLESGRSLHSMHNIDMIGFDGNGDGVLDLDAPEGPVSEAYEAAADALGIRLARTTFNSSDHVSFRDLGFTAACLSEHFSGGDYNRAFHTPADTELDLEYLQRGTELVTAALARLMVP